MPCIYTVKAYSSLLYKITEKDNIMMYLQIENILITCINANLFYIFATLDSCKRIFKSKKFSATLHYKMTVKNYRF